MPLVVIENATINARGVIDAEALPTYEARGWVLVGVTSDQRRDPVLTDDEQAAADATAAAKVEALTAPAPPDAGRKAPKKPASPAADTEKE